MKRFDLQNENRLIYICTLLIMATFTQCKTSPSKKNVDTPVNKHLTTQRIDKGVSLISLIADPERYDRQLIRVKGFLTVEFEGTALYLHKQDCDLGISENSIWVDMSKEDIASIQFQTLNKQYVLLEGTFDASNKGHFAGYSGSITKITRSVKLEVIKQP